MLCLSDPAEQERRRVLFNRPQMKPLNALAAELRCHGGAVPDFDPLDGGTAASILILLEKPGPGQKTGYVSRDNETPTAAAIARFAEQAGLPREHTVLWNAVPWWNGTTRITAAEAHAGRAALPALLRAIPGLRAAILAGRVAGAAARLMNEAGLPTIRSAHPSPNVRAGHPLLWHAIPDRWRGAAAYLPAVPLRPIPGP